MGVRWSAAAAPVRRYAFPRWNVTGVNDRCHLTAKAVHGYYEEWEESSILEGRHDTCGIAIDAVAEPTHPSGATFSSAQAQVRRFVWFWLLSAPTRACLIPTAELHRHLLPRSPSPCLMCMFKERTEQDADACWVIT